tara:strand:- start:336 stop:863 length:528 start_codon:yes stop_codon:yes gene_type:complete
MKKSLSIATLLAAGLMYQPVMAAAEVKINWHEPDSYQDIRPSNQSRSSFRKMVFADLEQYMTKLAEDLPDGQTLSMTVTDLDLAGEVWPASLLGGMGGADIRLVKPVYIPRMSFSYTLKDASGSVLQNAEVKLKDMAFMDRGTRASRRAENLTYEKAMLKDWFEKALEQTASHLP